MGHGGNGFVFDIRIIENNYRVYQSTQRYVIKILILKKTKRTDEKEKRRIRFQREITAVRQVGNQKLDILPILDSYLDVANSRYEWYVMPKAKECKYLRHIGIPRVRPQCWELSVNLNELYLYTLKYVL